MGENAAVGPLTYSVVHTEWKGELGEPPSQRLPQHRFLLVRMSVTHGGSGEAIIPGMTIEDGQGNTYQELSDGAGVSDWLGMIRRVAPAQTESGVVLFDAPLSSYKLKVSFEGDDPEKVTEAYIDLPLQMESDPVLTPDVQPPAAEQRPGGR